MEFLDHIKDDYMVPRKCINKYHVCNIKYLISILIFNPGRNNNNDYYWREMAEIDFELNKIGLTIYNHQLDLSKYKIFNSDFYNPLNKISLKDFNNIEQKRYNFIFNYRLEIFTYYYEKIRDAKWLLNEEILLESQKRICNPRFINLGWDDLEKEIDEYFDNH
jgi:hypothetical protein